MDVISIAFFAVFKPLRPGAEESKALPAKR